MNHDPLYQRLQETGWRRALTAEEAAALRTWLAAHPEVQPDWETEEQLTRALRGLADVPVASTFTARVLQAGERETALAGWPGTSGWRRWWRPPGWVAKAAVVAALAGVGLFSVRYSQSLARQQMARSLATLAATKPPSSQALLDFESIQLMGRATSPDPALAATDPEILTLLK